MTIDSGEPIIETPAALPAPIVETPAPVTPEPKVAEVKGPTVREGVEAAFKAVRERPRDEGGRFAAAEAAKKAALSAPQIPAVMEPKPVATPVKVERPADMPKAWGADKTALWAAMTPEQRAYVTDRETQMEGFHSKFGGLSQWHEAAAANNTTLPEVLDRVNKVETAMIQDPSQGLTMACEMVGMDRNATAKALMGALQKLGVQIPAHSDQTWQPEQPQALPPEVAALRQELDGIKSIFARQQEDRQRAELGKAQEQVKTFFADPANKYANDVANEISAELKAMKAMGIPLDLPKAYERAMWNRPDLRAKLIAEQVAPKQDEAAKAQAQALEKARSASRSVAGSPPLAEGRSSAERPSKLRDEIAMRVRNAAGRV